MRLIKKRSPKQSTLGGLPVIEALAEQFFLCDRALSWQTLWYGPCLLEGELGSLGDVSGALPAQRVRHARRGRRDPPGPSSKPIRKKRSAKTRSSSRFYHAFCLWLRIAVKSVESAFRLASTTRLSKVAVSYFDS